MQAWLASRWVTGAGFMAAALILAVPVLIGPITLPMLLIYLHSPAYMLHQVEEHTNDRFRRFVNARMFGGVDALTERAVLWINLPGVWGVNLAALYAARVFDTGAGLAAPYLVLVNAVTHVIASVRLRGYNPGVLSSVLIFLPVGVTTLWFVPATAADHAVGLGVSLAIHGGIVISVGLRAAALKKGRGSAPNPARGQAPGPCYLRGSWSGHHPD